MSGQDRSWVVWTALGLAVAGSLPYVVAWLATPADAHFTGLVFNPIDGHSYLAKMRQGWDGSWRFQLPFTPERSPGAPVYLFYLGLGHLARWVSLPLPAVYHGARIVGGLVMLAGIYALSARLGTSRTERRTMFLLATLGSGLGWLAVTFGARTADLWVPEAFPFYALMANGHFALAIGLMTVVAGSGLRLLATTSEAATGRRALWPSGVAIVAAAVGLGAVQPFGLVPAFGGLAVAVAARGARALNGSGSPPPWRAALWIVGAAVAALLYPLYMQVAIGSDPVLAAWNAQNVTASPPLWDWALSYGLVLVLAIWGVYAALRRRSDEDWMMLGWAVVTVVGLYLPLPLQRRLSLGLGVPLGLLAGIGWWRGARAQMKMGARRFLRALTIALCALTPAFLIVTAAVSALGAEPRSTPSWMYVSDDEWAALAWLRDRGEPEAVVLCAPRTGTLVPAWAGQPVVYGHPFETLDADRRRAQVERYWAGEMHAEQAEVFLDQNRVRYAFVGPRERRLAETGGVPPSRTRPAAGEAEMVFESGAVSIYEFDIQE